MKRKGIAAILICLLCLLAAMPAFAADVFQFTDKNPQVFIGETITLNLQQDGKFTDGEVVYTSNNTRACTVDEYGTVTGVARGQAYISAQLKQNGRVVRNAKILVNVYVKVTKVSLLTEGLTIYEPDDPAITPLLKPDPNAVNPEDPEDPEALNPDETEQPEEEEKPRILVIPAGKSLSLKTAVTPEQGLSEAHRSVTYESSDAGILRVQNRNQIRAIQPGECELVIRSNQRPEEVTETFHVLVIQPVKKLQVTNQVRNVSVGGTLGLDVAITPADADIQDLEWRTKSPKIVEVDQNGIVTGIAKGTGYVEAKALDGSNVAISISVNVIQDVTDITLKETEATVATKRSVQLHATVLPQNANDKRVTWTSSDTNIATVGTNNGVYVTGRKAGECMITCTSVSNPDVSISIPIHVIQLVTKIEYETKAGLSFYIGESRQLDWRVLPDDATNSDVTFSSGKPGIAVVDQNGIVTGISKGEAYITATAADGSGVKASYKVNIMQPVTGIVPLSSQYYVPLYRSINVKGAVEPKNANNQRIRWSIENDSIATVKSNGMTYGAVTGQRRGWTTLTATTDDGGFTSTANLIVDDFDYMVDCRKLEIDRDNKIKLELWNISQDYTFTRIFFRVEVFDTQGYPLVCNKDGKSTGFEGYYPYTLYPGERTVHGRFNFGDYVESGTIGYVIVYVTGYEFENGQRWTIPEEVQKDYYQKEYSSRYGEPTPEPPATPVPPENNG